MLDTLIPQVVHFETGTSGKGTCLESRFAEGLWNFGFQLSRNSNQISSGSCWKWEFSWCHSACLSGVLDSFGVKNKSPPPISHPKKPNLLEFSCALFLQFAGVADFFSQTLDGFCGNLTATPGNSIHLYHLLEIEIIAPGKDRWRSFPLPLVLVKIHGPGFPDSPPSGTLAGPGPNGKTCHFYVKGGFLPGFYKNRLYIN